MKRGVKLAAVCTVAMTGYCFYPSKPASVINLDEAVTQNKVSITCSGLGGHSGKSMEILVKNTGNEALQLRVPEGTLFEANNDEEQNLVVPEAEMLTLAKGAQRKFKVAGYCTELSDKSPHTGSGFTMQKTKNENLLKLVDYFKTHKGISEDDMQEAIWCVTGDNSVSSICGDTTRKVKDLREFVCQLTGQKNTWYDIPMDRTVTPEREISNVPTIVTGMLEFEATEVMQVQSEIRDARGKVITKNPETMTFPKGKFHFDFKVTVKGWEKGKYTVMYYTSTKTLIKQEFEI